MDLRTIGGFFILCIALALQFFLAGAGIYVDLVFAALITFAFIFDIWELILFVALSVFVINWKPGPSLEILVFALFPLAAYLTRNLLSWQAWLKNLIAIIIGFLALYISAAHGISLGKIPSIAMDIFISEIFGLAIILPLYRPHRA